MIFPFSSTEDYKVDLKPEHDIFRRSVREFAEKYVEPRIKEIESSNEIPGEVLEEAARMGFFGLGIPEEYGGQGVDHIASTIYVEEISKVCPALTVSTLVHQLFVIPLLLHGSEEQRRRYLPDLAKGRKHAAHATTEPGAGSDVAGIQTKASKQGSRWVINGRKYFISGADKADYFVVLARTSPITSRKDRWKGLTMFIVERGTPGFRVGERIPCIGLRGSQPNEVILDNVEVPEENVVGKEGEGFKVAMDTYDHGRIGVAAQAVGIAQSLVEKSVQYAMQRRAFDKPIIGFQAVQLYLSEMLTELQAARLLVYWASSLADKGKPEAVFAASMAKYYATEVAERAAIKAISIHGGMGVATEGMVERFLRDVEVMKIYEGTNEIQKLVIMRQMVKQAFGMDIVY